MRLFIGTYTTRKSAIPGTSGNGVMTCLFNSGGGYFSHLQMCADVVDPSWLQLADDQQHLFVASERLEQAGEVFGFSVDAGGGLTLVSSQSSQGLATCHLTTTDTHLYATSYLDGRLSAYTRDGGCLKAAQSVIQYSGNGPNLERQKSAHAHQAVVSPNGRWLYVCDLGSDCIRLHSLRNGVPTHIQDIEVGLGFGPRHMVFHPSKPLAWCVCELTPVVLSFGWNEDTGRLHLLQTFKLLDCLEFEGFGAAAAIHLHPSARLLGISDRAADSICLCTVGETGALASLQRIRSEGRVPRDFAFTPDGRWLIIAYQDSNSLTSHSIAEDLTVSTVPTDRVIVNSPVCISIFNELPLSHPS